MRQRPRQVRVHWRTPRTEQRPTLTLDTGRTELAPKPEDLRHLQELSLESELRHQQPIGQNDITVNACTSDRLCAGQPVDHVACTEHALTTQSLPALADVGKSARLEAGRFGHLG